MNGNESLQFIERGMGMYIHIPFCKQKCIYCDFPAYQNLQDYYDTYVYALLQEMTVFKEVHPEVGDCLINTIYFGGGTPTELSLLQLEQILNHIKTLYAIADDCYCTIEVNPDEVTKEYLIGLLQLGFHRVSFGVQTFDDAALLALHRSHSSKDAINAVQLAYEVGFSDINIDLIYGLPNQTVADIEDNLEILESLPVHHVSTYDLQVEEGTYLYHLVQKGLVTLPDEDAEDLIYETTMSGLETLGFERYEISNFAKHGSYSAHNLKYWRYVDYLGFGAGAHSFYKGVRWENNRNVMPYIRSIDNYQLPIVHEEVISKDRAIEDYAFLALRTKWGLSETQFLETFDMPLSLKYGKVLKALIDKNLIIYEDGVYRLTTEGIKQGNYVFTHFIGTPL